MPKVKSHSSSKKRFRKNGAGKIKRAKAYKRHHSWAKTKKRVRQLGKAAFLEGVAQRMITQLLPYNH